MDEFSSLQNGQNTISLSLNQELQIVLTKLISWGKFVGIMNIIQGSFLALTIFLFILPTAVMGIFYIFMGIKLVSSADRFQLTLTTRESNSLIRALGDLKSYIVLNGVLFIIGAVFVTIVFFALIFIGGSFWEIFWEAMDDFAVSGFTSTIFNT